MNAVENQVCQLVDVELAAANERFPQFHSAHEGYAVILEEIDELKETVYDANEKAEYAWTHIKHNGNAGKNIQGIMNHAVDAACEAIQVAAMCKKFLGMNKENRPG